MAMYYDRDTKAAYVEQINSVSVKYSARMHGPAEMR